MKKTKVIILILSMALLTLTAACRKESVKSRIAETMRTHVEQNLNENETFNFVGTFNRRDTVFMGVTRPCTGVIYTITDHESRLESRHSADVIFSDDHRTALCIKELDFDPIEMVKDKVKEEFKTKIREKLGKKSEQ